MVNRALRPAARCVVIVAMSVVTVSGCDRPAGGDAEASGPASPALDPDRGAALSAAQAPTTNPAAERLRQRVEELRRQRRRLDETVWADEMLAQEYERYFVDLWDRLNHSSDPLGVLAGARFRRLTLGEPAGRTEHDHGISVTEYGGPAGDRGRTLTPETWRRTLADLAAAGYRLVMTDWHHEMFEPEPPVSIFSANLYALNRPQERWVAVHATLRVSWSAERGPDDLPLPDRVTVTGASVVERNGPPLLRRVLRIDPTAELSSPRPLSVQPLILRDLDGDTLSEIIIVGANLLLWNRGGGRFERARLLSRPPEQFHQAALIADLTGDGLDDLLCAAHGAREGQVLLYEGEGDGRFSPEPLTINSPERKVVNLTSIAAGDIDGDGDLDLWLAQYKPPNVYGQMPTPYYDANDGLPSYLLRHDGDGRFTDITERAMLAAKRHRRTYSSSLADLDGDGDLDLVTVNDFAGVDVHHNDGTGRFTDVTERVLPRRHAYGMSHALDDFDLDGRLDLYAIGMSSPVARRLDRMGLGREEFPDHQRMRMAMAYGNRMFLGRADGAFAPAAFADRVARTGWSWGVASFDFDNDGDRDLYIGNGNQSGASVRDYCSVFWRHDIYSGGSEHDPALHRLFLDAMRDVIDGRQSWDGYQKNVLFMNEGGEDFLSVAFPLGLAFEFDARSVAADDLDGDGRVDLLIVEEPGADRGQVLHILRNTAPREGNWIGVRLREGGGGFTAAGAAITIGAADRTFIAQLTLDGNYAMPQRPRTAHFGLGDGGQAPWIEVRWPNGRTSRIENPAVNRYHEVRPPAAD